MVLIVALLALMMLRIKLHSLSEKLDSLIDIYSTLQIASGMTNASSAS